MDSGPAAPTILVVSHVVPYPPAAGNEIRILKMVRWLKATGFRVVMLLNHEPLPPERADGLRNLVDAIHLIGDDYQVSFPSINLNSSPVTALVNKLSVVLPDSVLYGTVFGSSKGQKARSDAVKAYLGSERLAQVTRHLCERYKPVAVIAEYIFAAPCLDVVPRSALKIVDTHDMFSRKKDEVLSYGIEDPLPCSRREERKYLLKSDLVIAIQPHEARLFRRLVRARDVITIGIDFDVAADVDNGRVVPGTVLVVGSDNPLNRHGLNEFCEHAWPVVRAADPTAVVRVVGKLSDHVRVEDERVQRIGWVPDISDEYRRAEIVINPTMAGTGLKIKSVEALCQGKALISTPNGVDGIEANGAEPYVVGRTWHEFGAAMLTLLRSAETRESLERRALTFAREQYATAAVYAPLAERLRRVVRADSASTALEHPRHNHRTKMRIAIWHNLPTGGGKRQLYNHVRGLIARGHHLESWCPDTADQKYLPLGELIPEHVVPLVRQQTRYHNPLRPLHVTQELLDVMERHCRSCAAAINRGDFDILFANACMFLRTTPIAGFVNLPTAMYLGEPFRWFYEAMPELPWIAPDTHSESGVRASVLEESSSEGIRLQARAELEYAKRFDLLLTNSVFSRETILRAYNLESKVCYLGVDSEFFKPTGEAKQPFVVGLGTIYHGKGVDRAIRAISTIQESKRPPLIWIGNGALDDDLARYETLARRLNVSFEPKIHISHAEVVSLLSRATAMLFTSRLEPFGFAPLEANACGTPVVAIAEGGVKETIVEGVNGLLCPDDDPVALGRLVTRFIDSPELLTQMSIRAREHVASHWKMEQGTDNVETILDSLRTAIPAMAGLTDKHRLQSMQPTNDLRFNLDEARITAGRLHVRGWAHVNDGTDAAGSQIFILVKNESDAQLLRTIKARRPDVTSHFGGVDYDESGFRVDAVVDVAPPYRIGILVVRPSGRSLQFV